MNPNYLKLQFTMDGDGFLSPSRWLVYDFIESFPMSRAHPMPFRIRIWLAKDLIPVVLVSQAGKLNPRWASVRIANHVQEAYFHFSEMGFLFFEWGKSEFSGMAMYPTFSESPGHVLRELTFETFGHACRKRLFKPYTIPRDKEHLFCILGEEVDL